MLSQLKLNDFRCFESLELQAVPGAQFFVGDNAQGKTSILEAICVLLRLATPRSSTLTPLVRVGARGLAVQGQFGTAQMQFYFSPERRKLVLDGVEQSSTSQYLKVAKLVYFGNTDLELIRGGGEGRRKFLDFSGHKPNHSTAATCALTNERCGPGTGSSRHSLSGEKKSRRTMSHFWKRANC